LTAENKDQSYKEIFKKLNYGVYLLGSGYNSSHDLITCTWVMQGSYEYGELIVNIGKERPVYSLVRQSARFSLSILGIENINDAIVCSKSTAERQSALENLQLGITDDDIPYLQNSLAYLNCQVKNTFELDNTLLVIGNPIGGKILSEGETLTLHEYNKMLS